MTGTSFPDFITSRRRELDLTLGDVASRLGVSPITVSNWSNGDSRPKPENLVALAGLLEVPAEDLAKMAGVTLGAPEAAVNLMPAPDEPTEPEEPLTEESDIDEPVAAVRMAEEVPVPDESVADPGTDPDEEVPLDAADSEPEAAVEPDEVPIPLIDEDPVSVTPAADEESAQAPDSVPAFVAAASEPEPKSRVVRRPSIRRPSRRPAPDDGPVAVLPLTYVEDPKQLMRYRIRWALTVVVLVIMFFILLWASRELLSALSEVKQAVTPGGIGGG
ncbi:MAG: helix-turn-helix domain-containing protein [Acidimicrobiia bacterium]|nr:helix-turn-helix domain-containing protein [Acidimicrobiia bacterium]NNL68673.1 helix-turn-helix domain-containing protein [Acidimicrobiia bacterium]